MSYNKLEYDKYNLYYEGNRSLLEKRKISIVGTRKPSSYTKSKTYELASKLSKCGICIVSGGAMGVDAISHKGAGCLNTISVFATGIDIIYPKTNEKLIENIKKDGLVLSQFDLGFKATKWSFVVRNELIVTLGDILIVTEADLGSGTQRSIDIALKMNKEIYVLTHRVGESRATQNLLKNNLAKPIYDIDEFISSFVGVKICSKKDDFLTFCSKNPSYDEAVSKFGNMVFEYELEGKIMVKNGTIVTI